MRTKLVRFFTAIFIVGVMSFSLGQPAMAAYGTGNYGACAYQTQAGCADSAGAPDTGQQSVSLLWPIVAGIIGAMLVSFVAIRYFNHHRASKQ